MIILLGQKQDNVIRHVASYLKQKQQPFVFINQDRVGQEVKYTFDKWFLAGEYLRDDQIQGVFNRWILPEDGYLNQHQRRLLYCLDYFWPNVLNKPQSHCSNTSKPYQMDKIKSFGLQVPESFIYRGNALVLPDGAWIYKSISGVRSIVERCQTTSMNIKEPVLFQRYIKGVNIRLHLTSQRSVAIGIVSDDVDYRYSSNTHTVNIDLPIALIDQCQSMRQALDLAFCGIDLILSEGIYYVLEVNPMPAYCYFEQLSGQLDITEAVFGALMQ